jgi:hypothetical protein
MSRVALICALAVTLLATSAHAGDIFEPGMQGCSQSEAPRGCAGPANPNVIAALKKRYPDADEVWAFEEVDKNGKYRYGVAFDTAKWHMACRLTLNPIKFSNCRIRHA